MISTVKREIAIEKELRSKIEWACTFSNCEPKIKNGNLRMVEKTNIAYVEPHRVFIKDKLYLFFNGETADDIAKRKGLRYREDILDNMGSTELIANLFRISQTEEKLKKDNVNTEKEACKTHNKIGKIVRKAIKEAGGTMLEELPTPKKSLKQLEREKVKQLKYKH